MKSDLLDSKILRLVITIGICEATGIISSLLTASSVSTWYTTLNKPWFTPPGWLFGPAWTTLYALMGIALFWIWNLGLDRKMVRQAVVIFGAQLFLNFIWSPLFFGLQSPLYGLIVIVPLWLAILATIVKFYRLDRKAGLILIPYMTWVSFATPLNYSIFVLN